MNWIREYFLYLLFAFITHNVKLIQSDVLTFEPSTSKQPTTEVPRPIHPIEFEALDTNYKAPRKFTSKTWTKNEQSKNPSMIEIALQNAAREGIDAMTNLYQRVEPQIVKNGQVLEDNHPAALLSKFSAPAEGSEQNAMAAFATLTATKAFRRNFKEPIILGRQAQTKKVSFRRTPLEGLCPPRDPPTCMPASQRYRTHDGTCNNRRRLRWGSAQMPFNRFLPPEYGDGVESIRGSVEGGSLSSARFVSLLVHGARDGDAPLTLMIVQWGQLLDHDMTSTAQPRSINGSVPSCCGSKDFHPSCFPIKVPLDDPWLAGLKVRCLEFLRSAPAQRRDCVLSWREQTNQVTSFIDASPIYSSSAKTSDNARLFRSGLLIYGRGNPEEDICMRGALAHKCIRSGDGRSGEQPGLLALHHVWVGEHNRIAMELSILNPHWSDEKVYQETRRIVGALFQHITYREFLPVVLGREVCKLFDLDLLKSGFYTGYDSNTNPSVANSFAAAAFRFGHSLVPNSYMRCDRHYNIIPTNVTLHEEFQQGDIGTAGSLHRLLRGLATQRALKRDEFITPELTNHLFQTPGFPFGLDLAAINIQRGRDHGIAPYTAWRQPCGLSAINTWDDLSNVVGPESAKRISHAYRSVHDIDLFVGGIAERPVIGGLVGPTFACIIAQQFSNSRKGDRFWYENSGFESSFTPAQLQSVRRVSLSSVICRALGGGTLQPHIFIPSDVIGNQRIKCGIDVLAPIDLKPWLEQDPFLSTNDNNNFQINQPLPSLSQSNKEQKGVNNRIQNMTLVSHVDFIPNSSIGFHRVPNMTKIHDKLDMVQKFISRPILKPLKGISNKLDKERLTNKKTSKPTPSNLSKRTGSTTRRTVVIHNVEIELRSADKKTNSKNQNLSLATTAHNTIMKVADVVKSQISAVFGGLDSEDDQENDLNKRQISRHLKEQTNNDEEKVTNEQTTDRITFYDDSSQTLETENKTISIKITKTVNNDKELTSTIHSKSNKPQTKTDVSEKYVKPLNYQAEQDNVNFQTQEKTKLNGTTNVLSNNDKNTTTTTTSKNDTICQDYNEDTNRLQTVSFNLISDQNITSDNSSQTYRDFQALIDSALEEPVNEHKRVHRRNLKNVVFQLKNVQVHTNIGFAEKLQTLNLRTKEDLSTGRHLTDIEHDTILQTNLGTEESEKGNSSKSDSTLTNNTTEEQPTLRNVELRQFQERPIYNRPQKLLLDGPNSEQYEIEINIRTKPPNQPSFDNANKRYDTDRYEQQNYDFSHSQSVAPTRAPYTTRTKPPTIIYLNEHDQEITTRAPGFFQNILTFANGLNNPNRRTTSTASPFHYSPNRIVNSGSTHSSVLSSSQSNPLSGNYLSTQPVQPYVPPQGFPQQGFPQQGFPQQTFPQQSFAQQSPPLIPGANSFSSVTNLGGFAHASSSAVSSGQFGAIAGSAASSGGDSTFSFNIRPSTRPQLSVESMRPVPKPDYELIPQRYQQHSSTPNYASPPKPISSVESYQYPPNRHDPFSGYTRRPLYNKRPTNDFNPLYDELGRSEIKIDEKSSKTNETKENGEGDFDDYDYNDDSVESETLDKIYETENEVDNDTDFKTQGNFTLEQFEEALYEQTLKNNTLLERTELDDNFVLPVLRQNDRYIESILNDVNTTTSSPHSVMEEKSFDRGILAEDYDELLTAKTSFLATQELTGRWKKSDKSYLNKQIALAPINVLTKPERPDNWVIFDTLEETIQLPSPPDINVDTLVAEEVPMPFSSARIQFVRSPATVLKISKNNESAVLDTTKNTTFDKTNRPHTSSLTNTTKQIMAETATSSTDMNVTTQKTDVERFDLKLDTKIQTKSPKENSTQMTKLDKHTHTQTKILTNQSTLTEPFTKTLTNLT